MENTMTTKTATLKTTLRQELDRVNQATHHGGNGGSPARVHGQAAVARAAIRALQAKLAACEAGVDANPNKWFDDVGYLASGLIDLL